MKTKTTKDRKSKQKNKHRKKIEKIVKMFHDPKAHSVDG